METYLNKKFSGASSSEWLSEGVASFQPPGCLKRLVWLEVKCILLKGWVKDCMNPHPTPHICISEL